MSESGAYLKIYSTLSCKLRFISLWSETEVKDFFHFWFYFFLNNTSRQSTFKSLHFFSYFFSSSFIIFSCFTTSRRHSSVAIISSKKTIKHVSFFMWIHQRAYKASLKTLSGPILILLRNPYNKIVPLQSKDYPYFCKAAYQVHKFQILYGGITIWSSNTSPSTPPPDVFHSRFKKYYLRGKAGGCSSCECTTSSRSPSW